MNKTLLSVCAAFIVAAGVQAQESRPNGYHFVAADSTISSWWTNNVDRGAWMISECDPGTGTYAEFNYSATEDSVKADWLTDVKITLDSAKAEWSTIKEKPTLNFWVNPLDGINAGDSIKVVFELATADGGKGWPGVMAPVGAANTWKWVSVDFSEAQFSGALANTYEVSMVKFSPQPSKAYGKAEDKYFKLAIQDATLSNGPKAIPATDPCGNPTGATTAVNNAKTAKAQLFFPNPAKGNIFFNSAVSGQIFDITGKVVASFNNASKVDINSISNGVYFIKVGTQVEKLVIR